MTLTLDIDLLDVGKNVIDIEANALIKLRDYLGNSFVEAVRLIASVKGRVIISGMGKSVLPQRERRHFLYTLPKHHMVIWV
jgi:arabinose-5-phosphate isomerase